MVNEKINRHLKEVSVKLMEIEEYLMTRKMFKKIIFGKKV